MALVDIWKIMPRKGYPVGVSKIKLVIGEPYEVGEGEEGVQQAMETAHSWMEKQLGLS